MLSRAPPCRVYRVTAGPLAVWPAICDRAIDLPRREPTGRDRCRRGRWRGDVLRLRGDRPPIPLDTLGHHRARAHGDTRGHLREASSRVGSHRGSTGGWLAKGWPVSLRWPSDSACALNCRCADHTSAATHHGRAVGAKRTARPFCMSPLASNASPVPHGSSHGRACTESTAATTAHEGISPSPLPRSTGVQLSAAAGARISTR